MVMPEPDKSSEAFLPDYSAWIGQALLRRWRQYAPRREQNLISLVTSAYNTPPEYLRILADSIAQQDFSFLEWVVVDDCSTEEATITELQQLVRYHFVRFFRAPRNLGIMGGLRYGVERARGRYVINIDHDDYLYPDAVRIMTSYIQEHGYPALLYSDEDKVEGNKFFEAYLKPGWDPVLFFHSCYIAHLGAIDRGLAAMLGAYSDDRSKGCQDWDTFMRFLLAGYDPVHVPEVLYSWRRHPGSCASNIDQKDYIHSSHQNTLRRFLMAAPHAERYTLEYSPLFNRTPDWRIGRRQEDPPPLLNVVLTSPDEASGEALGEAITRCAGERFVRVGYDRRLGELRAVLQEQSADVGLVRLISADAKPLFDDWFWESLTLIELFRETVIVGGPAYDDEDRAVAAGMYFGFDGDCGSPDRFRSRGDPGYFAQMWKPHSVSAVSAHHAVIDGAFLSDALFSGRIPDSVSLACLGEWLGAVAARWGKRTVYSPFLAVRSREDFRRWWSEEERRRFSCANAELIPETRLYSRHLGLSPEHAYLPVPADDRILNRHCQRPMPIGLRAGA
jgi:hypothetical protein